MAGIVGIDIGGTSVKIGIVQTSPKAVVVKQGSCPTGAQEPGEAIARRIAETTKKLIAESGVKCVGVGVGCPGLINPIKGMAAKSPNLPTLAGFPLKATLEKYIGLPVELQNDANAAALGEWLFGPNRGCRNFVYLTLGTGVGGGVIADGKLLSGADNAAAELGHLKVNFGAGGAVCGCGRPGCIEAYVGSAGITRIANGLLAAGATSRLLPGPLDTKTITEAAKAGDEVAKKALFQVGEYLGRGIALIIEAFNPEKVVLGGGASPAVEFMMPGIQHSVKECASFAETRDRAVIEKASLADEVNVLGAAATFLNLHPEAGK